MGSLWSRVDSRVISSSFSGVGLAQGLDDGVVQLLGEEGRDGVANLLYDGGLVAPEPVLCWEALQTGELPLGEGPLAGWK